MPTGGAIQGGKTGFVMWPNLSYYKQNVLFQQIEENRDGLLSLKSLLHQQQNLVAFMQIQQAFCMLFVSMMMWGETLDLHLRLFQFISAFW